MWGVYKPPGWYRGRPGAVRGRSHPCPAGAPRSVPPGAPRPRKRGCRTRSVGQRARVAPWGPAGGTLGTISSTPSPSRTLLPSRASGQSVISVKSFMAAGGSGLSLAKILPGALRPPAPPAAPPQLSPWARGGVGTLLSLRAGAVAGPALEPRSPPEGRARRAGSAGSPGRQRPQSPGRPLPPRPVNPAQLRMPRSGSGTENRRLKGE